jgi:magnesium-transporting ATPase (P-type)
VGLTNVQAALLPDDKRRIVAERVAAGGKPLVVGDGINDAAALAAGHVGLALAGGTDLANAAAAVTLYPNDLRLLPWMIALSRQAVRTVRQNLCIAFGYNLLGMALAAAGVLHPVVAAFLMVGSSLYVAWAALRLGVTPTECGVGTSAEWRGGSGESEEKNKRSTAAEGMTALIPSSLSSLSTPHSPLIALIHAFAFALQGPVLARLAGVDVGPLTLAFAVVGVVLGWVWWRWETITHEVDMNFGMVTMGNLGMVLGWWADVGFGSATGACPCGLHGLLAAPWMWLGMLIGGNVGMMGLMRRPCPVGGYFRASMFGGGNVGMLVGMILGGQWASSWLVGSVAAAVALSFVGMTVGMIVGMLVGYVLCLHLLPLLARLLASAAW